MAAPAVTNAGSGLRFEDLIGALLAEQNERWLERKYFDMDEFQRRPKRIPQQFQ